MFNYSFENNKNMSVSKQLILIILFLHLSNNNSNSNNINNNNNSISNNNRKYSFEEQMTKSGWLKASDGKSIWPSRSRKAISCLASRDMSDERRPRSTQNHKGFIFRPLVYFWRERTDLKFEELGSYYSETSGFEWNNIGL